MADYSADGVWDREGCAMTADELPLSAELVERIRAWQAWYEKNDAWKGDRTFPYGPFSVEGLAIARQVKRELPDWTVVYFDEAASEAHPDGPRSVFEYEIATG